MTYMLTKKKSMSKLAAQNDSVVQETVPKVADAFGDTGHILVHESSTEYVVHIRFGRG